ncbi:MAG TPA: biotin--[acetyl-CoA-carboxylase] ligase [Vicinamibacterales bacterium]
MSILRPGPIAVPDDVAEAMAVAGARVGPLGCRVTWFADVGSTNDEAIALANRGAEEGWLVGADSQSAGRGRHGRSWSSPPGAGLYLSVVLRPPSHAASLLTLAAGVGVAEGIQAATGAAPRLKWPNDVYLVGSETRKVAGILAEGGTSGSRVDYVVVGVGVNVRRAILPPHVAARATSLEDELGRPVSRGAVAAEVCAGIWRSYQELLTAGPEDIVTAWRARGVATFGRGVEWDAGGVTCRGVARDVDRSGALVVETGQGLTHVVAGEVRWTP